ncbi:MAG: hypothetical protein DBX47_01150 [Clostridiales bacterium]|nr:MAG: hypothetical protein DBX47_01150 [Clostridiales bacterium]
MKKIISTILIVILALSFPFAISANEENENDFKQNLYMGDWVPAMDTEEQVKTMAENGVQYTFVWFYDYNNEKSRKQVEWCAKYGIKCILKDVHLEVYGGNNAEQIAALTPEKIYEIIEPNLNNPAVVGYNIWDEPGQQSLYYVGMIVDNFKKAISKTSSNLIPFVNLYPPLAGMDYESYMNDYFEKVKLDYVSFDIYPLLDTTQSNYIYAVNTAATAARNHNADFWIFIQSMSFAAGHVEPDLSGLRFQAYTSLAFGAKKLMHFCYKRPGTTGEFVESVASIDADGVTKTPLWDLTQQLNSEMHFLSPIYSKYKNLGTYVYYPENPNTIPPYLNKRLLLNQYVANRSIKQTSSDQPLLIGVFNGAMILLNASEITEKKTATVSIDFRYADKVFITRAGERIEWLPGENGKYEITLESGEGVFVELNETLTTEQQKLETLINEYREIAIWQSTQNEKLFVTQTYESFIEALNAVSPIFDTDNITYEELLPLVTTLKTAYKNIITVNMQYRALTEEFFKDYSTIKTEYFSAESFTQYEEAKTALKNIYDLNPSKDTLTYNRSFIKAYTTATEAAKQLSYTGLYGDLNFDGRTSLIDAMLLFLSCAGKRTLDINQQYAADISKNGSVNLTDAMTLFKRIAGKE